MKTSTLLAITVAAILVVLAAFGGCIGRGAWERRHTKPLQADTVCVWIHDTVKLVETKPAGTVVVKLPVVVRDTIKTAQNDNLLAESAIFLQKEPLDTAAVSFSWSHENGLPRDSVQVEVPIEQKTYEGENYRAVVQGFRPELVSIDIRQQTVTVTEYKRKWWSVTIGPQLGYGFTPAGWQPYAGIGITAGISF